MKTFPNTLFSELEFDVVRQRMAQKAVTEAAQKRLQNLTPFAHFVDAQEALTEVNELLSLYQTETPIPALSSTEVDTLLLRLKAKNAILEPEDFLAVKDLVSCFNNLHRFFNAQHERAPLVLTYFNGTQQNAEIPTEIDRVFDIRGEIKSTASPALAEIRNQLKQKRVAADRIFYRVVKKYQTAGYLGDINETVHHERRVLAVNSAYKSKAHGIFHGRSAKQSLLFVEPAETVEINNEIALLLDEEQLEIKRILKQLTAFLGMHRMLLVQFAQILREIDFIHAKARYAYFEEACLPKFVEKPTAKIIAGINPVLRFFNAKKQKNVVPLHASLTNEARIIVISGPNAGGKSITLKTIGLLQLMMQSGVLVPVNPRSTFGWFSGIMADIGDAQSIENELSTYSSKLGKMTAILKDAMPDTLVLMDEFGSGSDPELGSALAQVFLEELNTIGAYGVLTTHFNAIKALANKLPNVVNASMQFNTKTFAPEYKLNMGTPGSSYTFEVARRVGIHPALIKRAKQKTNAKTVKTDQLLVDVQREKNALATARKKMHAELDELNALKNKHTGRIKVLENKLEKQRKIAETQTDTLQWGKRFESLVKSYLKYKSKNKKKEIIERFIKMIGAHADEVQTNIKKAETKASKQKAAKLKKQLAEPIVLGDNVRLLATRQRGTVEAIKRNKYLIALGPTISTTVTRNQFVKEHS